MSDRSSLSQRQEALQRTEKEIVAEKAATLGRAGERLEAALRLCAEMRADLERVPEGAPREGELARYRQARTRVVEARRTLIIQREAIGLRNHRLVDQQFPEPPPSVDRAEISQRGVRLTRQPCTATGLSP